MCRDATWLFAEAFCYLSAASILNFGRLAMMSIFVGVCWQMAIELDSQLPPWSGITADRQFARITVSKRATGAKGMLAVKHPQRFVATGGLRFDGVIYGDGKAGLSLVPARVYHGRFGSALFQTIYQPTEFRFFARSTSLEWHLISAAFLSCSH